jgi:ABC-type glycerol-3-phosphate transport system permease component
MTTAARDSSLIALHASLAWRRAIPAAAGYLGLALVVLIFGVPLYWMASASLKTLPEIYTFPPIWLPRRSSR